MKDALTYDLFCFVQRFCNNEFTKNDSYLKQQSS